MERLTPIDLEHINLKQRLGGYEKAGVDALIRKASVRIEELIEENFNLKKRNERLASELERRRAEENTLKDALILAQRTADETRQTAHRHAEVILEEARLQAASEKALLQDELNELKREIELSKIQRQRFVEEFRTMLERYNRDLPVALSIVEGEKDKDKVVIEA